MSKYKTTGL